MSTGGRNFSDKFLLFHYFTSEKQSTYVGTAGTVTISVTRLGNLLDFGQLFIAFGNN